MTKWNFMLSWVEHEKSFITSGPDQCLHYLPVILQFLDTCSKIYLFAWNKIFDIQGKNGISNKLSGVLIKK